MRVLPVVRAPWWVGLSVFVVLAVALAAPPRAHAHPDLDQAMASAEDAEFDAALTAFERAIASGTLTRDELVTLLTERALVLHALGQRGGLAWDLATLALIEPGHDLGRRAPPELVSAFAEATKRQGAAVAITASCEPSSTGMRVSARVTGLSDPALARIRLHTQRGSAETVVHDASEAELAPSAGETVRYHVELVGLGQVVLARDGSAAAPRLCEAPELGEPSVAFASTDRKDGKNHKLWWWLGAGGAVAIAAVTVGLVVASGGDDPSNETSVGRPMVSFK